MATGSVRRDQLTEKVEGAEEALPSETTLSTPTQDYRVQMLPDFSPRELRGRKQRNGFFRTVYFAPAFLLVAVCSLPRPTATPARFDDGSNVGIGNGPSPNSAWSFILEGLGSKTGANRSRSSRYPEEEPYSSLPRKGECR